MMKKLNYLFALTIVLFLAACTPTPEEGIKYNDAIIAEQTLVMNKVNDLDNAIATYIPQKMDKSLSDLVTQLNSSIDNVKKMKDFDRKTDFKDATVKYFTEIKTGVDAEMKEVVKLSSLPEDQYTEEVENKVTDLLDKNIDRTSKAQDEFEKFQYEFAKKYKFKIEDKKK